MTRVEGVADEREWRTYQHPAGHTVEAHVVTEDTKAVVVTPGQGTRATVPGDILVQTDRPDVFDVYSKDAFGDLGLTDITPEPVLSDADAEDDDREPLDPDAFNPDEKTAAEVNAYLSRTDLSTEERERVIAAERAGRNRSSAFPK